MFHFVIICIILKASLRIVANLPLLFTSYLLAGGMLDRQDTAICWITLIVGLGVFQYYFLYFVKGILIGLKRHGNLLWLPVLIVCIGYTSIWPAWLFFVRIGNMQIPVGDSKTFTLMAAISLGMYFYSRYHFLTNMAPVAAYPAFRLGLDASYVLMKLLSRRSIR